MQITPGGVKERVQQAPPVDGLLLSEEDISWYHVFFHAMLALSAQLCHTYPTVLNMTYALLLI